MNERIIDLIERSHTHSFQENRGQFVIRDFSEKFAELIIRECIDICLKNHINTETISAGECAYDIQKHFGVE